MIEGVEAIETAKTVLVKNTKNFIRRQFSWFQADDRVVWVDASALGWDGARGTDHGAVRDARASSPSGRGRTSRRERPSGEIAPISEWAGKWPELTGSSAMHRPSKTLPVPFHVSRTAVARSGRRRST